VILSCKLVVVSLTTDEDTILLKRIELHAPKRSAGGPTPHQCGALNNLDSEKRKANLE
jgi:hypothetical protein